MFQNFLINPGIERGQLILIKHARLQQRRVRDEVGGEGLVDGVVPNDVGVVEELLGQLSPEIHELVSKPVLVLVESVEDGEGFGRRIVDRERLLVAFRNQRPVVLVFLVVVTVHGLALAVELHDVGELRIRPITMALSTFGCFFGIEVRDSLTASNPSHDILVSIDHGVDSCITEVVNERFDFVEVSMVVLAGASLDSLPHDSEAHEVHSIVSQIGNILSV
mmetsp:Transcript_37008/g.56745  ORF Transcript_37008/g.56745 Transcript_37008/m.56745 type:complete len:221 (-) Transcript_37008:173-835(-)